MSVSKMKKDQLPVLHSDKMLDEEKPKYCCSDERMARYAYYVGCLFTLILGPWSGAQLCVAYVETDFIMSAAATMLLFIASFLMTAYSKERAVVRVWWVVGMVWMVVGYIIYYRKDFTQKPEAWLYVATAQSGLLLVTSLPLIATDPGLMTCM